MLLVNGILIYILLWWVTLFAVLPLGVRGQAEENEVVPGSEPGAPIKSNILKKFLMTTIISVVLFVIVYFMIVNDVMGITKP